MPATGPPFTALIDNIRKSEGHFGQNKKTRSRWRCMFVGVINVSISLNATDFLFLSVISPMAVDSSEEGQDVYNITVFPAEPPTNLQCESKLATLSFFEVLNPFKNKKCLDTQLNSQDYINLQMEKADVCSPCSVDVDIEKGNKETPITNEENVVSLKAEGSLTHLQRILHREISLHIGGKLMQLLIDHSLMLLKLTSRDKSAIERVHDTHTPNNRWRKYKRSASFDSRNIVLFFSVLSSMGTMILIYLTLRVRQMGDGSVPL